MEKFVGIDSGKYATKITEVDQENNCIKREFSIRTKMGDGDFRDDAIEENTVVAEYNGTVYKIGNGARGESASLDNSKTTEVHKICTLVGLACLASADGTDVFNVATGIPVSEWANVSKRCDFKDFILPQGEVTITVKKNSNSEPVKKTFTIKERYVYPESIGGLLADKVWQSVKDRPDIPTGVIDIGNLNVNVTFWQGMEPVLDKCSTSAHGGVSLIEDIAQELTSRVDACDSFVVLNVLTEQPETRHLPSGFGLSDEQVLLSGKIIAETIKKYVQQNVYSLCRKRNWSVNSMRIVAIGGTSEIIEDELKEQFGNIALMPNATYCNARGYAMLMCANSESYGKKEISTLTLKEMEDAS